MKTVKINYAHVEDYFDKEQNLIYDILKNHGYDVQISDEPDYIICDALGAEYHEYYKISPGSDHVFRRKLHPGFNLIDYSILPYPIRFGDRNFSFRPACAERSMAEHSKQMQRWIY